MSTTIRTFASPSGVEMRWIWNDRFGDVLRAMNKGTFNSLSHASATIRRDAVSSIKWAPRGKASMPGTPPNTHRTKRGSNLYRRAILFHVYKTPVQDISMRSVIGPRASTIGDTAVAHEFGRPRGKNRYPERPTMGPALERNAMRFGLSFRGALHS